MSGFNTIIAKGLTEAWVMMTPEQRTSLRLGTVSGERALEDFNNITADDVVDETELELVLEEIIAAGGSASGKAIQSYLMSLFKSFTG